MARVAVVLKEGGRGKGKRQNRTRELARPMRSHARAERVDNIDVDTSHEEF